MPRIELQSMVGGVRGPNAQGGRYVPGVDNGVGAALGEVLGRAGEAFIGADLHGRMERLARMEEENQAAEAELAFERWSQQALYGTAENQTATALGDFDKEKNPEQQAMRLNGLLNARGMAALDGGKMYGAASDTVLRNILGWIGPSARARVANRLRARREAMLTRLNVYGLRQGEAAQAARSKAVLEGMARAQSEDAARNAANVRVEYESAMAEAERGYQAWMANMMGEKEYKKTQEGEAAPKSYAEYKKDWEAKAASSRAGQIAAAEAKRAAEYALIGEAWGAGNIAQDERTREMILSELGISEEQAASPEWAPVVEGRMAAAHQNSGYAFLSSMVAAGETAFVKDALKEPTRYGITDRRLVSDLGQMLTRADTTSRTVSKAVDDKTRFELEQALTQKRGGGYEIGLDEIKARVAAAEAAGDFGTAQQWQRVYSRRVEIENNDAILLQRQEATQAQADAEAKRKQEEAQLALEEAARNQTPEQWRAWLDGFMLDPTPYYTFNKGQNNELVLSKHAIVEYVVENKLGLRDERDKQRELERITRGSNKATLAVQRALSGGGGFGVQWQATVPKNGSYEKGEPDGDVYPMGSLYGRGNFSLNAEGDFVVNDGNVRGVFSVVDSPDGSLAQMGKEEMAQAINAARDYMDEWIASNPTKTETEIDAEANRVLTKLFTGSSEYGFTNLERMANLQRMTQTLQAAGEREQELLSYMRNRQGDEVFKRTIGNARENTNESK